jgi:hypothetical protein
VKHAARFLALLLVALIPLQGLAAATSGLCMALGHHEPAESEAVSHDTMHAHGSGVAAEHHHGHGAQPPDEAPEQAHCPPCVACCAASAISSSSGISIPASAAVAAVAKSEHAFSGVAPESLDRPPLAL